LAYQPPASITFLSQQTSHQQPVSNTFLSEQISTSHQPPAKRTGCMLYTELDRIIKMEDDILKRYRMKGHITEELEINELQ
jgi:hypothetical protein